VTEKERERKRRWLLKNPAKRREVYLAWQRRNPEKTREYTRKWRKNNLEKSRALNRANQKKRAAKVRIYEAKRRAERLELVNSIKLAQGCALCGYNEHPEALDFDHLNPSEKRLGIGSAKTNNLQKLLAEIAKCRVLCSNCHRIETAKDPRVRAKRLAATGARASEQAVTPNLPLFQSETVN